jgi:hypothetical protein
LKYCTESKIKEQTRNEEMRIIQACEREKKANNSKTRNRALPKDKTKERRKLDLKRIKKQRETIATKNKIKAREMR